MFSGIIIACFAGCYAIALAMEASRTYWRVDQRGTWMLGLVGVGLLLHSAFVGYQAATASGTHLSSKESWCLVTAWLLTLIYLYLVLYHPRTAFGVYVLPLVLGLIAAAATLTGSEPFAKEPASRVWAAVHGTSVLLATVSVLVGFSAGLMYLVQAKRLKRKLPPPRGLRLPALEWLRRANSRAIVLSMLMLGVGILSGVVLNRVHSERAARVAWSDPFVVSTMIMFVWLLLATLIGFFYRPAREGRKVAYFTVVSFVFLVLALGIGLFVDSQHGGTPAKSAEGAVGAFDAGGRL
jgi:ABC-type uncharacterized transport system permease subunit